MKITSVASLEEGETFKFQFHREGVRIDAFLLRYKDRWIAYENRCRHLPISLDFDDNRFMGTDGRFIICQTHGARYEPLSGRCVDGPCGGMSLFPLEVEEREGDVWLLETAGDS